MKTKTKCYQTKTKTGMSRESFGLLNHFDISRWLRQSPWQ